MFASETWNLERAMFNPMVGVLSRISGSTDRAGDFWGLISRLIELSSHARRGHQFKSLVQFPVGAQSTFPVGTYA